MKKQHPLLMGGAVVAIAAIAVIIANALLPERYADVLQYKWIMFTVLTGLLVGCAIKWYWPLRASSLFWKVLAAFWLVHVTVVGYLVHVTTGAVPFGTFEILGALEWAAFALLVYSIFRVGPKPG